MQRSFGTLGCSGVALGVFENIRNTWVSLGVFRNIEIPWVSVGVFRNIGNASVCLGFFGCFGCLWIYLGVLDVCDIFVDLSFPGVSWIFLVCSKIVSNEPSYLKSTSS